jgi:hypothetical protein
LLVIVVTTSCIHALCHGIELWRMQKQFTPFLKRNSTWAIE